MSNYGVDNIQHLETREAMRTRIQMYLGSDMTEGMYQALKEIINNSTDEAMAGYGNRIEITINEEINRVSIRDYGRGVPFGIKDGKNVLVAIYTESHTGGKFDKGAYKNSSGLNGIGGTAVCMSSSEFAVTSHRNGTAATAIFCEGNLVTYKETPTKEPDGTLVSFVPDKQVFVNAEENISYEQVCKEIKNISYLNKGIHFIVDNAKGKSQEYYSENGIADFIKDQIDKPLMKAPIIVSKTDGTDELEIAFMWTNGSYQEFVFVNGLYCPEGGSPVTGAKRTITTYMKKIIGKEIDADLIRKGLVFAINCKVANPSFANQTKNKINNPSLQSLAAAAFKEGLEEFSNTPDCGPIIEMMKKFQKAEWAAEKARLDVLTAQKKIQETRNKKVAFLDKLTDAEETGQDAILCVVEGDSAGNTVVQGRGIGDNRKKYGVMGLKGKMLNGLKEEDDAKYYANKEIELLIYALGIDINNYNPKKLRYGKVAICVDADDDGLHIFLLIMVNLYRLCPQFLRENRVVWLRAPLYIEYDKKDRPIECYYSDEELSAAKRTGKIKGRIDRNKGLGSMEDADIAISMFSEKNQRIDEIEYSEEGIKLLCDLMGPDIKPRKDFIFSEIDFSKCEKN